MAYDTKQLDDMTARFWAWFDRASAEAKETELGKRMTAAGFTVTHTGGGCLAWERTFPDGRYIWLCDEDQELHGQPVVCGLYDREGDPLAADYCPTWEEALRWAETLASFTGRE
jgi:hypothetical protein